MFIFLSVQALFTGTSGSIAGLNVTGPGLNQISLATGGTLEVITGLSIASGSTLNVSNGTLIIYQEQTTTHVTYHHIELESHDTLMAEGLPYESFLDTGNKTMFETVSGVTILYPDFRPGAGAEFCASLIRDGAELDQLRAALTARIRKSAA